MTPVTTRWSLRSPLPGTRLIRCSGSRVKRLGDPMILGRLLSVLWKVVTDCICYCLYVVCRVEPSAAPEGSLCVKQMLTPACATPALTSRPGDTQIPTCSMRVARWQSGRALCGNESLLGFGVPYFNAFFLNGTIMK